jgi:hypothetical protein
LSRSEGSKLHTLLGTIIAHRMKRQGSPAVDPGFGWTATISRGRITSARHRTENPELRPSVPAVDEAETPNVQEAMLVSLTLPGEPPRRDVTTLAGTAAPGPGAWHPPGPDPAAPAQPRRESRSNGEVLSQSSP